MLTDTAIKHFGTQVDLARALGIKSPSISNWGKRVPWRRQLQLEAITFGALRHNPTDIPVDMRALIRIPKQGGAGAA